jgi:hypothetical protein
MKDWATLRDARNLPYADARMNDILFGLLAVSPRWRARGDGGESAAQAPADHQ